MADNMRIGLIGCGHQGGRDYLLSLYLWERTKVRVSNPFKLGATRRPVEGHLIKSD